MKTKKEKNNYRYKKIENNLEIYMPKKQSELKDIAKDLVDGKIFSDRHIPEYDRHLTSMIFMVLALGGSKFASSMIDQKITFVYEYLNETNPRAINGYPTFFTLRMLNDKDTEKMFKYYDKIKEMKEEEQKKIDAMEIEDEKDS